MPSPGIWQCYRKGGVVLRTPGLSVEPLINKNSVCATPAFHTVSGCLRGLCIQVNNTPVFLHVFSAPSGDCLSAPSDGWTHSIVVGLVGEAVALTSSPWRSISSLPVVEFRSGNHKSPSVNAVAELAQALSCSSLSRRGMSPHNCRRVPLALFPHFIIFNAFIPL